MIPNRQSLILVLSFVLALGGCSNKNQGDGTIQSVHANPTNAAEASEMSADDAIKRVQSLAKSESLQTTVSQHYTETNVVKVPCSPIELDEQQSAYPDNPELWRCPKTINQTQTKCCHVLQVPVPADVVWRASKDPDGKWHVEGDFAVEGEQHHATFTVDSQTRKVVQAPA